MAEFTKGPLRVSEEMVGLFGKVTRMIKTREERIVAICAGDNAEGNAQLYAAAPELYEALKESEVIVETFVRNYVSGMRGDAKDREGELNRLNRLRVALAKAEGESRG